jgi:uncharacterized protein (AIM24 family)
MDTKWGGFKNIGGGEGGFLVRASGTGKIVVACYGAIETIELGAGEGIVLDSGHLVAFDPTVEYITRKVTKGIAQTLKSGEGFVMEFTGPGRILTQTRNPGELIDWLTVELPFSRETRPGGRWRQSPRTRLMLPAWGPARSQSCSRRGSSGSSPVRRAAR